MRSEKGFAQVILIGIVALLIIGTIGFFAYKRGATSRQSPATVATSPISSTSPASPNTSKSSTDRASAQVKAFYESYLALIKPTFNGQASSSASHQINTLIEKYVAQPLAAQLEKPSAGQDNILCVVSAPQSLTFGTAQSNGSTTTEQVTTMSVAGKVVATVEVRDSDLLITAITCP